jgi:hypothetical protein
MAPLAGTQRKLMDRLNASISQDLMPVSTYEEQQQDEQDTAEEAYDVEAEAESIGQATISEHYSTLTNRLFAEVNDAAQESKAPSTLSGYRGCLLVNPRYHRLGSNFFFSQIKKFKAFIGDLGGPELINLLEHPAKDTPTLIAAWIRNSCDPNQGQASRRKRGGAKKGAVNGWPQAQKMRSSVSHYFSIDQGRGSRPFTEREDGSWTGNPSLSDFVAQYMKSLKRRKASTDCTQFLMRCFNLYLLLIA